MRAALTGAAWWSAFILLIALGAHVLTVQFLPTALMAREMNRLGADGRINTAFYPPPAAQAKVPIAGGDPNTLLAACVFDLTQQNLRVHATVPVKGPWSITIYGEDAKPFFFQSNETPGSDTFDRILAGPGSLTSAPGGTSVVKSPFFRGIVLIRTRITAKGTRAESDRIRHTASCKPVPR